MMTRCNLRRWKWFRSLRKFLRKIFWVHRSPHQESQQILPEVKQDIKSVDRGGVAVASISGVAGSVYIGISPNSKSENCELLDDETRDIKSRQTIFIVPINSGIDSKVWSNELRRVQKTLRNSNEKLESLTPQDEDSTDTIKEFSNELTKIKPSILHVIGSTKGIDNLVINSDNENYLNNDKLIVEFFSFHNSIRCLILSGCYLEPQAREIAKEIDFIIGYNSSLDKRIVNEFIDEFYFKWTQKYSIQESYKSAINYLKSTKYKDESNFPQLLIKQDELRRIEIEKELNSLDEEIKREINQASNLKRKAELFRESGKTEEALEVLKQASNLEPNQHEFIFLQGENLKQSGQTQAAIEAYNQALVTGLGSQDYKVWWEKAKLLVDTEQYLESASSYRKALSILSKFSDDYDKSDSSTMLISIETINSSFVKEELRERLRYGISDHYVIYREYGKVLHYLSQVPEALFCHRTSLCLQPKYRVSKYEQRKIYKKLYTRS
jgi:tetratricopeptide (TPR) repeat protein